MTLSIGTLVGYLELNDSTFQRKADAADRKMQALQLHLKALEKTNPKVKVEVDAETSKLDLLRARIAELKAKSAEGIDVNVDMVGALVELDRVQMKLRGIHRDMHQFEAETVTEIALMARLAEVAGRISDRLEKVPAMPMLLQAFAVLGPLATTAGGAAIVGLGAIGSAALGAAAGVAVLHMALSGIGAAVAAYKQYQQQLDQATTAAERATARKELARSAYGHQSAAGKSFTRFYADTFQPKFAAPLRAAAQSSVLPGIESGLKALLPLVPTLSKMIERLGGALGQMADRAGHALNSPFWRQFFTWLGVQGTRYIKLIGDTLGHFIEGTARGLQRFAPTGQSLLTWVDHLARKFNAWTKGDGFTKFMDTVQRDAAAVGGFFHDAGPAIGKLLAAFNEVGISELSAFGGLLKLIGGLPQGIFNTLAVTLPIILLALKGMQIAGAVAGAVETLADGFGLLTAAMEANPLIAIATALILIGTALVVAYKKSQTFRDVVNGVFRVVRRGFAALVDFWLWEVGLILHGAAKAFGWVPGLGPKLRAAAAHFDEFRDHVNNTLAGIHDKTVTVGVKITGPNAVSTLIHPPAPATLIGNATGTNNWRGGLTLVGENGPELVNLQRGAQVVNAAKSNAMLRGSGQVTQRRRPAALKLVVDGKEFTAHMIDTARNVVLDELDYASTIGG